MFSGLSEKNKVSMESLFEEFKKTDKAPEVKERKHLCEKEGCDHSQHVKEFRPYFGKTCPCGLVDCTCSEQFMNHLRAYVGEAPTKSTPTVTEYELPGVKVNSNGRVIKKGIRKNNKPEKKHEVSPERPKKTKNPKSKAKQKRIKKYRALCKDKESVVHKRASLFRVFIKRGYEEHELCEMFDHWKDREEEYLSVDSETFDLIEFERCYELIDKNKQLYGTIPSSSETLKIFKGSEMLFIRDVHKFERAGHLTIKDTVEAMIVRDIEGKPDVTLDATRDPRKEVLVARSGDSLKQIELDPPIDMNDVHHFNIPPKWKPTHTTNEKMIISRTDDGVLDIRSDKTPKDLMARSQFVGMYESILDPDILVATHNKIVEVVEKHGNTSMPPQHLFFGDETKLKPSVWPLFKK